MPTKILFHHVKWTQLSVKPYRCDRKMHVLHILMQCTSGAAVDLEIPFKDADALKQFQENINRVIGEKKICDFPSRAFEVID